MKSNIGVDYNRTMGCDVTRDERRLEAKDLWIRRQ